MSFGDFLQSNLEQFWHLTGFYNAQFGNFVMLAVGLFFIWLAIKKNFEPMLLVPIGFGILIGNIPFNTSAGLEIGIYEEGSVLNILYNGVSAGWYPPLIFLGIGAMTDFSALIANPKLMLIGAAAQFGIFGAYMVALLLGFDPDQAGAIAIIGGADGPTAAFDETLHHQERASYQDETGPCRIAERENHLPHRGYASHLLRGTFGSASARYALLR